MGTVLVFNPGSNSLKFELVMCAEGQKVASEANKLASAMIDDIGKQPKLSVRQGRKAADAQEVKAGDMREAVSSALEWLQHDGSWNGKTQDLTLVGVRVVHGGTRYGAATKVTSEVRDDIAALKELAPLHNQSALDVLAVVERMLADVPVFATFDTAFHRSLPEWAWRYPIERKTADQHGIRKFGFHGVSHRYMLEQYGHTVGKPVNAISLVTLHLESGSSACAIQNGRSIDTTMGLTPLEGLMMGSRSGSIDPAIVPFLMRKEGKSADEILTFLNKQSGLLGIAGDSLDTRDLEKREDAEAKLALKMFSYRVRLAVGAYLAALGDAEAVLLGGGIGEDSPWLREAVCAGLGGWGLHMDPQANASTSGMRRITTDDSRLHAWAMPVEEGLQIAHECIHAFSRDGQ